MGKVRSVYEQNEMIKKIVIVIFSGVIMGIALNMFLIPANVFSAGVNGIAQLVSGILEMSFNMNLDTGILIFIMNIPIAILGWVKLGKSATIYSLLTVVSVTIMTLIVPVIEVTDNQLLSGIVGGVLTGVAVGMTMKYGFSTGGMDIVSLVLAKTTGRTVGSLMLIINAFIVATAGFVFDWESALYTIISIFCTTQVVDTIHTSHQKVTAFISTTKPDEVVHSIQQELIRGMTLLPGKGAYSKNNVSVIMIVVTKYELYELEQATYIVDENAFINIVPTQTVLGSFWNEDQQKEAKQVIKGS
ncbi:YitT family protein [Vagococcus carniphilus]|uniref:YitT family protein n=1 Tax=Vagococcus carniphilus TaxID=218144 RepID=A0AAW8U6Q8_9ENTE|nr:YitT family protein [Vagococcus carniphilus]MDT2814799.1 YitT family protein [Vagococcus carniphilus]MDT2831466.1 YitT family protein [Vagococcus carniphilus]MDT2832688.1 YitT family protein [Vagococcus carniphilus]MDT2840188.1 YitT family protein [Vagococcus carniphilus]MDT2849864.1 YitT family protein [Vagococcus carniphilus]